MGPPTITIRFIRTEAAEPRTNRIRQLLNPGCERAERTVLPSECAKITCILRAAVVESSFHAYPLCVGVVHDHGKADSAGGIRLIAFICPIGGITATNHVSVPHQNTEPAVKVPILPK